MLFRRKGKYILKITKSGGKGKKKGCSGSSNKTKKHAKVLQGGLDDVTTEIKDYFKEKKDKDYLEFEGHPLSDIGSLLDMSKPAPWDYLINNEDDEDVDIEIEERIYK
jgi:hypothetical protein